MTDEEFWDTVIEELKHNQSFTDSVREALRQIDEEEKRTIKEDK